MKDLNSTFRAMFSDSSVAQEFQLGADKLKYVVNWGLAPYFKDILKENLRKSEFLVISFDESLNKSTRNCQMDIAIRFWNQETERVEVRYWDSQFLGHTAHGDIL